MENDFHLELYAFTENRTQVSDLQDQCNSHYTISAYNIYYFFKPISLFIFLIEIDQEFHLFVQMSVRDSICIFLFGQQQLELE